MRWGPDKPQPGVTKEGSFAPAPSRPDANRYQNPRELPEYNGAFHDTEFDPDPEAWLDDFYSITLEPESTGAQARLGGATVATAPTRDNYLNWMNQNTVDVLYTHPVIPYFGLRYIYKKHSSWRNSRFANKSWFATWVLPYTTPDHHAQFKLLMKSCVNRYKYYQWQTWTGQDRYGVGGLSFPAYSLYCSLPGVGYSGNGARRDLFMVVVIRAALANGYPVGGFKQRQRLYERVPAAVGPGVWGLTSGRLVYVVV